MTEITVVIATRNRAGELAATLDELIRLPERPRIVVVDNASTDATVETVRARFPEVRVIRLPANIGAAARNAGAQAAQTPFVAFSDDDSWWAPGALARAADALAADRRLALVAACAVVEPGGAADPIVAQMEQSPLPRRAGLPGPPVLGFLACAAVVRREAFFEVGGFHELLFLGGEEQLLAYDLAAAGWDLAFMGGVVAHHRPSPVRDPAGRRVLDLRNRALIGWMRRPWPQAARISASLARQAAQDSHARTAFWSMVAALPRALRERCVLPAEVEAAARLLEANDQANADATRTALNGAAEQRKAIRL